MSSERCSECGRFKKQKSLKQKPPSSSAKLQAVADVERTKQLLKLREEGLTLKAIGALFNISSTRVSQILGRVAWRRKEALVEPISFLAKKIVRVGSKPFPILSTRASNVVQSLFAQTDVSFYAPAYGAERSIIWLATWTEADLLREPNCGRGTLDEIKYALAHYDLWLGALEPSEVEELEKTVLKKLTPGRQREIYVARKRRKLGNRIRKRIASGEKPIIHQSIELE